MQNKLSFYIFCAVITILSIAVIFNARTINRLTDLVIEQGKFNGKVAATLGEQGILNNDQEEFNGKVVKTLGVILR